MKNIEIKLFKSFNYCVFNYCVFLRYFHKIYKKKKCHDSYSRMYKHVHIHIFKKFSCDLACLGLSRKVLSTTLRKPIFAGRKFREFWPNSNENFSWWVTIADVWRIIYINYSYWGNRFNVAAFHFKWGYPTFWLVVPHN